MIYNYILVAADGTILVFGWNKNGQCGITSPGATSTSPPDLLVPQPLPHQPWRVTKVACGWNHTLALTQDGTVMAWGSNAFGQLGLPSVDKQSETPLPLSREARSLASCRALRKGVGHRVYFVLHCDSVFLL